MFEDADVKIGTKEEKFWSELKERTETAQTQCVHEIEINKAVLALCDTKLTEEKEKDLNTSLLTN